MIINLKKIKQLRIITYIFKLYEIFMKLRLTAIVYIFCLTNCNQADIRVIKKKTFYANGKIKNVLSLTPDSIKDGECIYFDEYENKDSSVTFSNGILDGLKQVYSKYGHYTDVYKNGILINHKEYDSLNVLKYETPLNINNLSKTTYKFASNRTYLDKNKTDTLVIINESVPTYNRGIEIVGPLSQPLGDDSFIIGATNHFHDFKILKIFVKLYQHTGDSTEIPTTLDTIRITVK